MQRLERLINLTATLLEAERPLTSEEIRERVPGYAAGQAAFRRAFERDKEVLRELGIPIVLAPLDPGEPAQEGYRIPRDAYELPDPELDADELAALHLAATTVRLPGARGVEALWKLGGAPGPMGAPAVAAALPGSEHLTTLFEAVADRRAVTFTYRGQPRTVEPLRLSFRNGHWYLRGRDQTHGDERTYRLDRVEGGIEAGPAGAFERPPAVGSDQPHPWEMGEEEPVVASVLVDADQAGWVASHLGADAVVERRSGGAVVVAVRVTNRDAFRSFVLGFLDHAEVVGPAEVRDDTVAWLEALCRR